MKHMKKSMFITTVFMVVLLIVAVSTATFAWYTSSNTVTTNQAELNSALSTGANIAIGWNASAPVGSSVLNFDNPVEYDPEEPLTEPTRFSPMTPKGDGATALTYANFKLDTPFTTVSESLGKLHGPTDVLANAQYIGKSGANSVFYVVNYARVDAKITFSVMVSGDNAARLRVAVFNASTKELVFLNRECSWGTYLAQVDPSYALVETKPTDWSGSYKNYFVDNAGATHIASVSPPWAQNSYWETGDEGLELVSTMPGGWNDAGFDYTKYSTSPSTFIAVEGVAPAFVTNTIYKYVPKVPQSLHVQDDAIDAGATQVTIGASAAGVTGIPQGFTVKAWFDGPTQVDAHGGQAASFRLTVEAA